LSGSDGNGWWLRLRNWRDRLASGKQASDLVAVFLAGLVGLLLNEFPLEIYPDVHLLFGGVVSAAVAMALGPIRGGLAALIAYLPTIWLWGHPQGVFAAVLENLALGFVVRRWSDRSQAGVIFWTAITAPLLARGMLFGLGGEQPAIAWVILIKGPLNSVVNVAVAILLLGITNCFERLGAPGRSEQLRSLRIYLAAGIAVAVGTPLMLVVIGQGRATERDLMEQARTGLARAAVVVAQDAGQYLARHQEAIASLAASIEQFRVHDPASLDSLLHRAHGVHNSFLEIRIADKDGKVIASHPRYTKFGEDSIHVAGATGKWHFFQETVRTGQRQVLIHDKGVEAGPVVAITSPLHYPGGELMGVVFGSLGLAGFSSSEKEWEEGSAQQFVILDADKAVLYASPSATITIKEPELRAAAAANPERANFSLPDDSGRPVTLASAAGIPGIGWRLVLLKPVASVHATLSQYYRRAALWTLAALLLSIILGEQVSKLVIRPLERLVGCVREMSGRPGHTAPVMMIRAAPKEIQDLGRDFETMSASLAQSYKGLQESLEERLRLNEELTRLLLQLKQNAAQLTEAKNRAEDASRAKSAFLANISHEIRTPLNGVMGALAVLQESEVTAEQKQLLRMAAESGFALSALVNNLLSFSTVAGGVTVVEQICFAPAEIAASLYAQYEPRASRQGLQLAMFVDPKAERRFLGDPDKIRQVWDQLLDNAVKFTNRGQVRMALILRGETEQSSQLRFEVSDTGIGVPDTMQSRIFEPFTQVDESTTRRRGGTGLGLALCRQIVERLGGMIGMQSQAGLGSLFWFQIPLIPEDPAPAPEPEPTVREPVPAAARNGPSVLVVEDNPVNQRIVCRLLEKAGFHTQIASDGRAALESLAGESFDAILMDCQMPVMDGYEAARQIRQAERNGRHVPIIAITAHAMEGDRERCLRAGMDDYITKPVNREALVMALKKWISAAHQQASQPHD
jgi:signal transduction histidine kinase/ActR/RegA family two-component response regulator